MTDFENGSDHRWLTRPRAIRGAKTFLWVLCITVLIWVYADLEKTEKDELHAKLVLRVGPGGGLAFLGGTDMTRQDVEVTFVASGSRGGLDRCRREMAAHPESLSVDLSPYGGGEHQLQAAELLRRTAAVRDPGLTVVSANPAVITVKLDRKVHKEANVRYGDTSVEATVIPPRMGVTVADSVWKKLAEAAKPGEPVLKTKLAPADAQTDANRVFRVEVEPFISGEPVEPNSPVVDVVLKGALAVESNVTLNVPIRIQIPPEWAVDDIWHEYTLERKDASDWKKEITFHGLKTETEKLRAENVDAYLPLSDNDKPKLADEAPHKGTVEVRLPGDSQIRVEGEKPTILFLLRKRSAATPPP